MKQIFIIAASLSLLACQSNTTTSHAHNESFKDTLHNSQNSLDWSGTYIGIIPCADCPGIETTVVLNQDETFTYKASYLERNLILIDSGKFMWHDHGSIVHIKGKEVDMKYKVGENQLFSLDQEEKIIDGPLHNNYILKKESTH